MGSQPFWQRLRTAFDRSLPTPSNFGKTIGELGLEDQFGKAIDYSGLTGMSDFFFENPAWVKKGEEVGREVAGGDPGRPFENAAEEQEFQLRHQGLSPDEQREIRAKGRGFTAGLAENIPKVVAPADVLSLGLGAAGKSLTAAKELPAVARAGKELAQVGHLADVAGQVMAVGAGSAEAVKGIRDRDLQKVGGGLAMVGLGGVGHYLDKAGSKMAHALDVEAPSGSVVASHDKPEDLSGLGSSFDDIFKNVDVEAPSTTHPKPEAESSLDDILGGITEKAPEKPTHLRTPLDEVPPEIAKPVREVSRKIAREFADTGRLDDSTFASYITEDLKPFEDIIRRQATLESSALIQGRTLLEDLSGWHGHEGPEGVSVYRSSNDPTSYDIVDRAGGKIIQGAQVRKNKLDMIAGGKAMDSPRPFDEIDNLLDELGAERGDVLTVLGARRRASREARRAERSVGAGAVEGPQAVTPHARGADVEPVLEGNVPEQAAGPGGVGGEEVLGPEELERILAQPGTHASSVPIEPGKGGQLPPGGKQPPGPGGPGGPGRRGRPPKGGRIKVPKIHDRPSHNIKDWVNSRAAADIEGAVARRDFEDLRGEGADWIQRYEAGGPKAVKGGERVQQYFADRLADLRRMGVPIGEAENYITHIWADDPEKVTATFRRLGIRPGFTQERVFETYKAGLDHGLTPKYDNIADIVGSYESRYRKLVSDQKFYNFLRQNKFVKPTTSAPPGWVEVRNFPLHRFTDNRKLKHVQVWKAPPEVALAVNRYLDSPISSPFKDFWQRQVQKFVDVKNVVMSSGVPFTALNAHGFNVSARIASVESNPILAAVKYGKSVAKMAHVGWAKKELEKHLTDIPRYIKAGATFALEDHQFKAALEKIIKGVDPKGTRLQRVFGRVGEVAGEVRKAVGEHEGGVLGKGYGGLRKAHEILFEDPLFQYALPAAKLQFMRNYEQQLLKAGLEPKEALHLAAHQGNEVFGGINWVEEGRDPQLQTFLRLALNAPDWAESNLRLGKGVLRTLKDPSNPRNKIYRNMMTNIASYYLFTNVLSKATSGKWAWEDPAERHLQVKAGKAESGRTRYLKPLGTGGDWARLPYEVIAKLGRGDLSGTFDVVAARLHPLTQGIINLVKNRNFKGQEITGEEFAEKEGKPMGLLKQAANVAKEVTDVAAPSYVKTPVAALAGGVSPEEILMKSVEAPVAYARPERSHGAGRSGGSGGRGRRGRSRRGAR